jgi:uncharacterized protein YbjT (DUF2867 family)
MILVSGGTGNVGGEVVALLAGQGETVRALSRNAEKAVFPVPPAEVVQGDLAMPESLSAALAGVSSVFLYAIPGTAPGFAAAARAAGVRKVVFLSSAAVRDDAAQQPDMIAALHAGIEQSLDDAGLDWVFIRPGALAANARQWAPQVAGGTVFLPYPDATSAPVHERDVAAVAVGALTSDDYDGSALAVTGPQSLSQAEQVAIIGEVTGRQIMVVQVPPEAARAQLVQVLPEPVADALLAGWRQSAGRPAAVTPTVQEVTGQPARSFREWVSDHRAEFGG